MQGGAACVSPCLWQQTARRCLGERISGKVESLPVAGETTQEEGARRAGREFLHILADVFLCLFRFMFVCLFGGH